MGGGGDDIDGESVMTMITTQDDADDQDDCCNTYNHASCFHYAPVTVINCLSDARDSLGHPTVHHAGWLRHLHGLSVRLLDVVSVYRVGTVARRFSV